MIKLGNYLILGATVSVVILTLLGNMTDTFMYRVYLAGLMAVVGGTLLKVFSK